MHILAKCLWHQSTEIHRPNFTGGENVTEIRLFTNDDAKNKKKTNIKNYKETEIETKSEYIINVWIETELMHSVKDQTTYWTMKYACEKKRRQRER